MFSKPSEFHLLIIPNQFISHVNNFNLVGQSLKYELKKYGIYCDIRLNVLVQRSPTEFSCYFS
jgi:hypothetical protein